MILPSLLCLLLFAQTPFAVTERNVTVDDNDSAISYQGDWGTSAHSDLDYGGTHELSSDITATATFQFTGTAVYMLSPKWPYQVNTAVSLDNGPQTTIDLVDHSRELIDPGDNDAETLRYDVVWSATGLQNTSHTLAVSRADNYVIVDGFIYTQTLPDEASSSFSSSSQTGTSTSSSIIPDTTASISSESDAADPQSASSNSSTKTVVIALSTTFGALAFLAFIVILVLLRRRKEQQRPPSISSSWDKNAFAPQYPEGLGNTWSSGQSHNNNVDFSPAPSPGFSSALSDPTTYAGYSSVPTGAAGITADSDGYGSGNGPQSTVRGPYDPYPSDTNFTGSTIQLHPFAMPYHTQSQQHIPSP